MLLTDKTVEVETGKDGHDESSDVVMEANLDDCTGEALGYADGGASGSGRQRCVVHNRHI